jgi:hypothetical protein
MKFKLFYGFLGSNFGDYAITLGSASLIKACAGEVHFEFVGPPLRQRVESLNLSRLRAALP